MFGGIFDEPKIDTKTVEHINKNTNTGSPFFLFFYMDGCGPCKNMKKIWGKLKSINPNKKLVIINHTAFSKLHGTGEHPTAFPTIRYIHGKTVDEYTGNHDVESMNTWIKSKNIKISNTHNSKIRHTMGGKRKRTNSKNNRTKKGKKDISVSISFRK